MKKEFNGLWRTVKLGEQWLISRVEELGCCRRKKVDDIRVGKGWSLCKGDCLSCHDEVLDLKALGLMISQRNCKVILAL
jgi:hypothetical protein